MQPFYSEVQVNWGDLASHVTQTPTTLPPIFPGMCQTRVFLRIFPECRNTGSGGKFGIVYALILIFLLTGDPIVIYGMLAPDVDISVLQNINTEAMLSASWGTKTVKFPIPVSLASTKKGHLAHVLAASSKIR